MQEFRKEITTIYEDLKDNAVLQGQQGVTNVQEFVAELANPIFRGLLQQIDKENTQQKTTLWDRIKNAFRKLFNIHTSSQYYNRSMNALDKALNAFDIDTYLRHTGKKSALREAVYNFNEQLYEKELQSIKEKALSDGTFMKAPNGRPTNLTERQWLQVRTKEFKEWFGDWEKIANFANKLNSNEYGINRRTEENGLATSLVGQSRGMQKGHRVLQKASSVFGRIAKTDRQQHRSFTKSSFLEEIEKAAKEEKFWIENTDSFVEAQLPSGQESEVYRSKDGKEVIKFNKFSFIGDSLLGVETFIERLNAHNELFPEDAYEVIGFAKDSEGNTCIVLKQPFIEGREATKEEIETFFDNIRAEKKGHGVYTFLGI